MLHDCRVTICGKRWRLEYSRLPRDTDGSCDAPTVTRKRLRIARRLRQRPRALLETLIHEAMHAAGWPLSEEHVEQTAEDVTRILWNQGFRLTGGQ